MISTHKVSVLDHGYVDLVEAWGSEEGIIEAARQSTNKGFEGWEKDKKLLAYLFNNDHATPFEMAGMIIEVKAPIFVFREWHRHRTQSYNEMSARYVPLPNENYMPAAVRCAPVIDEKNRQASGTGRVPTELEIKEWRYRLSVLYGFAQNVYEDGIELGISKEIARLAVPVARYSRMRASASLRNWLSFLKLRLAPNAQYEIRQYAQAVADLVAEQFPRTWELYQQRNKP